MPLISCQLPDFFLPQTAFVEIDKIVYLELIWLSDISLVKKSENNRETKF